MSDEFDPLRVSLIRRVYQSLFESLFGRDPRATGTKKSKVHEITKLLKKARELHKSRQYDEARELNQRAFLLSKFYHFGPGESLGLCQLATNENAVGDYEAAKGHANASIGMMKQIGDPYQSNALLSLGIACRELGEFALAMSYLDDAEEMIVEQIQALSDKAQDVNFLREDLADIYLAMGNVALYQGEHWKAIDKIKLSWQGANLFQDTTRAYNAVIDLVFAYILMQDWENAISTLLPALGFLHPMIYEGQKWSILLSELERRHSHVTAYSRTNYVFYVMAGYACQILHKTNQALDHYEMIWELLEIARRKLKNSTSRVILIGASLPVVNLALKLALEIHDKVLAYQWIERFRSRAMLDMLDYPAKYKAESSVRFFERWSGESTDFGETQILMRL